MLPPHPGATTSALKRCNGPPRYRGIDLARRGRTPSLLNPPRRGSHSMGKGREKRACNRMHAHRDARYSSSLCRAVAIDKQGSRDIRSITRRRMCRRQRGLRLPAGALRTPSQIWGEAEAARPTSIAADASTPGPSCRSSAAAAAAAANPAAQLPRRACSCAARGKSGRSASVDNFC
eukprot:365978-Chlamydomonas_euryale.AAC.5